MFNQNKKQEYVTLGKVSGSLWRKEELSEGQLNHHVHVVGASGYGKTVLLSHIIKQRIQQGKGLLFIDLKADKETLFNFSKHVAEADRLEDLMIFSLTEKNMSLPYNLVLDGTATQLRDRIMMSLEWSEEFYKNQSASFLLKLLIGLCWLRDNQKYEFHIGTILDCVNSPERIEELAAAVPENQLKIKSVLEDCYSFLNSADNFKSLQGLRTQLESIVLSDFGDLVATNNPGINLFEAATTGKIIFIFLDTRRYSETAKVIGRLILQDLKSVSARVDAEISVT